MEPMTVFVSAAWLRLATVCLATVATDAARTALNEIRALLSRSIDALTPLTIRELFQLSEANPTTPMPDPRLFIAGQLGGAEMQAVGELLKRYGCTGERWQIVCQSKAAARRWQASAAFDYLLMDDTVRYIALREITEGVLEYRMLTTTDEPGPMLSDAYGRSHPSPRESDTGTEPLDPGVRLFLGLRGPGNWSH